MSLGGFIGATRFDFDEVASTNDIARQKALEGCPEGTLITARSQTRGRGKQGSEWFSPADRGLYASVVLRPYRSIADQIPLTIEVSRSVQQAIMQATGISAELKWPNDVLIRGRKCAGILLESIPAGTGPNLLIVGVGVNMNGSADDFPPELKDQATTLEAESGRPIDREIFIAKWTILLEERYMAYLTKESDRVSS